MKHLLNGIRFILFLALFVSVIFLINTGFLWFMAWGISKIFAIADWKWYWRIFWGAFCLAGLWALWRLCRIFVEIIIYWLVPISPYRRLTLKIISWGAFINSSIMIYNMWTAEFPFSVLFIFINVLYTICIFQLFLAFYTGSRKEEFIKAEEQLRMQVTEDLMREKEYKKIQR